MQHLLAKHLPFKLKPFIPIILAMESIIAGIMQRPRLLLPSMWPKNSNNQPEYRPIDIIKDIQREQGVEILYNNAFRAKETATAMINSTHEEGYKLLPNYCESIKASNPGTTVILNTTEDNKFKRIFMCYGASAAGFEATPSSRVEAAPARMRSTNLAPVPAVARCPRRCAASPRQRAPS